jgi:hypothetical protein
MAVGVLVTMPGVTKEQYERVNKSIFGHYPITSRDVPDELILHSAGPTPDGWYVYDIWKSRAAFERFGQKRVAPAVREVTGRDFGAQAPQYFDIHDLLPSAPGGAQRA